MHLLLGLLCLGLSSPLGHGVDWSRLLGGLGSLHGLGSQVLSSGQFSILLGDSGIRIELEHGADVLQRVGLDDSTLHLLVGSSQHLPDGLALEQGRQVSVGHLGLGQDPAGLGRAWLAPGAVQTVQLLEGCFGPDAESANMTSRSQLEEVDGVNSRDVPECLGQTLILVVDDKRSSLLDVTSVSQLTLAGSHTSGGVHLGNIIPGLVTSEEHDSLLGLLKSLDLVGHNKRNLADAIDDVTLGHDQSGDPSGGNGGAHGVPLLGDIDLPVPPSPGLGGGEHTTSTAHVAESSLAGPVGTSSPDSGNSGNSSASSPGLSTGLVSGINIDAVGLASVLGDLVVDGRHDVGPHWGAEHGGQTHGGPGAGVLVVIDADQRASRCERHFSLVEVNQASFC